MNFTIDSIENIHPIVIENGRIYDCLATITINNEEGIYELRCCHGELFNFKDLQAKFFRDYRRVLTLGGIKMPYRWEQILDRAYQDLIW